MKEKRNKVICFTTTWSQYGALQAIAPSRDSLSQLLREIIQEYLDRKDGEPE